MMSSRQLALGVALLALAFVAVSAAVDQDWVQPQLVEVLSVSSSLRAARDISHKAPAAERLADAVHGEKWKRFLEKHGKYYATEAEAAARFKIFREQRKKIVALNDKYAKDRDHPIFKSIGRFADLTFGEFKLKLGLRPAPKNPLSFLELGTDAEMEVEAETEAEAEAEVDAELEAAMNVDLASEREIAARCGVNLMDAVAPQHEVMELLEAESEVESSSEADVAAEFESELEADPTRLLAARKSSAKKKPVAKKKKPVKKPKRKPVKKPKRKPVKKPKKKPAKKPAPRPAFRPVAPKPLPPPKPTATYVVDHRPILTPIKSQGMCGSCWAHVVAEAVEVAYARANRGKPELSPTQVLDCARMAPNSQCNGGNVGISLDYLKTVRLASQAQYPYNLDKMSSSCRLPSGAASGAFVNNWDYAGSRCDTDPCMVDENALLTSLQTTGPFTVGVDASGFQHYDNGIFPIGECSSLKAKMNHAMQVVGYGSENGVAFWLVRNTWSDVWGEDGYVRVAAGANACGLGNYTPYVVDLRD
jgi:outer membrane biosynthesis protein TonB